MLDRKPFFTYLYTTNFAFLTTEKPMPTFMDRYPELRKQIFRSELNKYSLVSWRKNFLKIYPETIDVVLAAEVSFDEWAAAYGLYDIERHLFRFLVALFTISKTRLSHPVPAKNTDQSPSDPELRITREIGEYFGTMTPFENQGTMIVMCTLLNALQHSISLCAIPATVQQDQTVYAYTTFLRDFDALRILKDPLAESINEAWKRTAHCIEPRSLVQQFMSGEILREADAHTYEAILLARLSLLQHVTHPETVRFLLSDGGPKQLYQHLLIQLYPHQPAQIAHVKSWAAKWQDGALIKP